MSKKALEKAFANPAKTKKLELDLSDFSADEFGSLFERISLLPALEKLHIYGDIDELPAQLGHLKQIKCLYIQSSEAGRQFIPDEIGGLELLEELIIERTDINTLPVSIGMLSRLRCISISQTNLIELPSSIGNLVSLETLECNECKLASIPQEIAGLKKLKHLSLEGNFTQIPLGIVKLNELTQLSLDGKFTNLPMELASLPSLSYLYLRGRFENLKCGDYKATKPFSKDGLAADLLNFEKVSNEKFSQHRQSVPWPVYEDSSLVQKRPLKNMPLLSSFKIVGLPGEIVDLNPSTPTNLTACKAFLDGPPLVFVSEAESNELPAIEGLCRIGVVVQIIQSHFFADRAELKLRCFDRVRITELKKNSQIVLATIDVYNDQPTDASDLAYRLKEEVLKKQEQYLSSMRIAKTKRDGAAKKIEEQLPRAIKRGASSFLFASAANIDYSNKQKLLTMQNEIERLQLLQQIWSARSK